MPPSGAPGGSIAYQHTSISVYLVATFAVAALFYNSCQGILQRLNLNRKWFYIYGATALFAYLYLRPLIRRQLGSASHGYINFTSVYIAWLCSAIFLHLPSFASLGIDFKTDLSLLFTVFLLSLLVLGCIHALHAAAVVCKLMAPSLYHPRYRAREMWSIITLNSFNLAIACSTYYGFCGNAGQQHGRTGGDIRASVCAKWLHPVRLSAHPTFRGWVIYGEGAGGARESSVLESLSIDVPLDGLGRVGFPAADAISPVFTLWITLVLMYLTNSLADYTAAAALRAAFTSELRRGHARRSSRTQLGLRRGGAAGGGEGMDRARSLPSSQYLRRTSLDMMLRAGSTTHQLLRGMSGVLSSASLAQLTAARPPPAPAPARPASHWEQGLRPIRTKPRARLHLDIDDEPPTARSSEGGAPGEERPDFLPMFPWYSGTSADMYRTIFDLLVSVKLFLGRYDNRQMQAATAAVPPGAGPHPPREGDGFTFEHLADRDSVWLDFVADIGDGGDPTYAVAACMAAPQLVASVPPHLAAPGDAGRTPADPGCPQPCSPGSGSASDSSSGLDSPAATPCSGAPAPAAPSAADAHVTLPRADILVIGGDLAYPNPSNETYETRFFRPYEAALPPPPHVHAGRLVVTKPDLPLPPPGPCAAGAAACACHSDPASSRHGDAAGCRACAGVAALRAYGGPTCFAIPGNHDWIDGLETFQRHVQHKGWLGGWLLPQENSYFALRLPHGWWLFGLDLALVDDIDMCQCRYFARIAEERMGPKDQVILVTHQPRWLMDWYWEEAATHNLRQLVRGHLRGRARVHLAGDLHFYMRHSFQPAPPPAAPAGAPRSARPANGHAPAAAAAAAAAALLHKPGVGGAAAHLHADATSVPLSVAGLSRTTSFASSVEDSAHAHAAGAAAAAVAAARGLPPTQPAHSANLHPYDPEHLVVNGLGGAFLHPTHVFAPARFASIPEPAEDDVFVRGASPPRGRSPKGGSRGSSPRGVSPARGVSRGASPPRSRDSRRGSFTGEAAVGKLEEGGGSVPGGGGEFRCAAAYPSPQRSLELGRQNLHLFRLKNTRFDFIGGGLYFLTVVSVLPRCHNVAAILDADSLAGAAAQFARAAGDTLVAILLESRLSLAVLCAFFLLVLGFARSGGIGAVPGSVPGAARLPFWEAMALRGRTGGSTTQLAFAALHTGTHVATAIFLMVLLELGVETCVRYEGLGKEGYDSLFRWYQAFEATHFPDPGGLRQTVTVWTLGLYPRVLQWAMAAFDLPEAIAVTRALLCGDGAASLSRLQALGYYGGMLAYYWVLATPAVGLLFGCYLYVAVNCFHCHYDEAFSALRIPHYKGFSRLRLTPDGDLVVYALAMDRVPMEWREDRRWREPGGAGLRAAPAHRCRVPSRWTPVPSALRRPDPYTGTVEGTDVKVVDRFVVPRRRPL